LLHAIQRDPKSVSLDHHGILRCGESWVALPKNEQAAMAVLISRFGCVVTGPVLYRAVWPDREVDLDPAYRPLNVIIFRLRKRLRAVGLEIATIRSQGFLLQWTS
jgi:DNA-binding winged helix-turn-helix (wHTH) protein